MGKVDIERTAIKKVFSNVIEEMAFMFGEALDDDEVVEGVADAVQATMGFSGPLVGTLTVAAPPGNVRYARCEYVGIRFG